MEYPTVEMESKTTEKPNSFHDRPHIRKLRGRVGNQVCDVLVYSCQSLELEKTEIFGPAET